MSAHTPGPWQFKTNRRGYPYQLVAPNGMNVKNVLRWAAFSVPALQEGQANARLIAAAPDLLAALRAFVDRYVELVNCGDCGHWNPEEETEVITARAAIAKAEGREP